MNRKEITILFLLACLNFTHILDFMIMMPLGNFLMPHFKINTSYFSYLVAAYPLSAFIVSVFSARFVDLYDRKKVLLTAYFGFLIGTVLCGLAPTAGFLLTARILTGLFGGVIGAQVQSIVADSFPYEKRGQAMAFVFIAFSVASALGVPLSLYLAKWTSWHAPFLFIGVLGGILIPFLIKFLPSITNHIKPGQKAESTLLTYQHVFSEKVNRIALFLSCLLMFGHFLIIPFINPFMEYNKGYDKSVSPLVYLVGGLATLITAPFLGKLADKVGKNKVFTISLLISLVPIILITHLPDWPMAPVLAVFAGFFMFSTARNIPAQAMISTVVEPENRGKFMSVNASLQQLATGGASLAAGSIVGHTATGALTNYHWVGALAVVVLLIALFFGRWLAKIKQLD
jgi:MFS transporter, DHA1 family, inner membrane transport protein